MIHAGHGLRFDNMESANRFATQCGGHFVPDPDIHVEIDLCNGQTLGYLRFVRDPIQPMKALNAF